MLLDDLKHVFKSSTAVSLSAKSYIVNLLNKFEVSGPFIRDTFLHVCFLCISVNAVVTIAYIYIIYESICW